MNDIRLVAAKRAVELPMDCRNVSGTNDLHMKALGLESLAESSTTEMGEDKGLVPVLTLPSTKLCNDGFSATDFHAVNDVCDFH
jgi:hypothetical protein